jgi:hypothetical protein
MARTVEDATLLFDVVREDNPRAPQEVQSLRIGAVRPEVQPDIAAHVVAALELLAPASVRSKKSRSRTSTRSLPPGERSV